MSINLSGLTFSLEDFKAASPNDLGPVAFLNWINGSFNEKEKLHLAYVSLYTQAQKSSVPEIQMNGKEMERMWKGRDDSVDNYWQAKTLKKLRSKNIIAAARNSSSLQISLGNKQLKDALHDLQPQRQRINQKAQEPQVRDPHPISINNTSNQCQGQESPSETTLLLQDQICSDIPPSQVVANSSTAIPSPTSLHAPDHKSGPTQNQNLRINDQPITTNDKPSIKRSHDAFPSKHSEEIGSLAKPSKRVCEVQQIEDDNTQLSSAPFPCAPPSSKATSVPSAVGASSAPTTSTPVPLKRGRTGRKKTVSAAVPAALSAPMASDTVPMFDPSSFGSSRPQISHPWHDLVRATLFLYEGEDVELLSEQSGVAEQDPEKRILYKLALRHLENAQAEMRRSLQKSKFDKASPKFDKTSCTDFKDAFVALSGVWNVFSKEANRAFQSADLQEVEELCRMAELENKDADVMEILNMLADKSRKAPLTDVVDECHVPDAALEDSEV
ncbi:hypothetical protein BGX21_005950 [Mortierella sp. AD011]|nr:hypothetical protein BGX21_005950 [Mortierella sp. AD011]